MKEPRAALIEDGLVSLSTWFALELMCFALLPILRVYPFSSVEFWFLPSIAFGLFGATVVGVASGAAIEARILVEPHKQRIRRWIARTLSVFGFFGIAFPLNLTIISLGRLLGPASGL